MAIKTKPTRHTTSPARDVFLKQKIATKDKVPHVITVNQFNKKQLDELFQRADQFREWDRSFESRREIATMHLGRQLCSLFYEPSTRTRLSFETAAVKLGMGLVSTENAGEFSSAIKGETLEDSISVLDNYGYDVIVMRHNEKGAAKRATKVSKTPIINGGDGAGEHPTQSLLDAYTIYKNFGRLNNTKIVLGGDLKNGRTVRSLTKLLAKFSNNEFVFVSVPELQIGQDIKTILKRKGIKFVETSDINKAVKDSDVVYWTRLQKERIKNLASIPKKGFVMDVNTLKHMPKKAIIMHPLPRVDEIHPDVDKDPRATYFEQAGNGLYVRMALLDGVLRA